jgi:hypothetical protein
LRTTRIKDNAKVEIINNVVYNWGSEATGLWMPEAAPPSFANIIGNYYKGGVDSAWQIKKGGRGINLSRPAPEGSKYFVRGNIGPNRTTDTQDEWDAVQVGDFDGKVFRADAPIRDLDSGIKAQSAADALAHVLKHAGAVPRDSADQRAISDTQNGTGSHLDKLEKVGGYPVYKSGTPPQDSDADGIPDTWEREHGLNPQDRRDATQFSTQNGGYLNLEAYINSLIPATS